METLNEDELGTVSQCLNMIEEMYRPNLYLLPPLARNEMMQFLDKVGELRQMIHDIKELQDGDR
jgi:hypothetical protein